MSENWKKSWKSSKKIKKQRKYRANAPYHHRDKFLSAGLNDELKDKIGTKTLPVKEGDKAEILRGDFSGLSGKVENVDYDDYKVYLNGIDRERVDGTEASVAIDPSNIRLTKLELDDERRLKKYEVSEEDKAEIQAEEEPEEEETTEEDITEDEEGDN